MKLDREKISYRRATVEDAATLARYRVMFINETWDHPEDEESAILEEKLLDYFPKALERGDFVGWLAEYEGKVIATSGMVFWQLPTKYGFGSGKLGYILNMFTLPEFRGNGLCSELLDKLVEEAKELKIDYLHLHATEKGEQIYRKAGFVPPHDPELELALKPTLEHVDAEREKT